MAGCVDIGTGWGTIVKIGAALPATYDQAGYEAVTWTTIGELGEIGELGKDYQIATFNNLSTRQTYKVKTFYDNGGMDLTLARMPEDAGQIALFAEIDDDQPLPYQIQLNDDTATYDIPSKYYFPAIMTRWRINPSGGDGGVVTVSAHIEICGDILLVARSATP